jgi:hypothetical protein
VFRAFNKSCFLSSLQKNQLAHRGCYHKIGISIEIFGFPRVPVPQFLIVIVDLLSPFCSLLLSSFYPFKISPVYFYDQFLAMISFLCVLALACFKPLTSSCLVLIDFQDRLIFYRIYYETMSTSILIEKDETPRRKSSFDVTSLYSLVDKAYYVDGLRYKVDK